MNEWTILIYKIPAQPTRLRLQVWRQLQRMGALYLHNSAWLVPARAELVENMHYIAGAIEEAGGACQLFFANALLPSGSEQIAAEFRILADSRLDEISHRLDKIQGLIDSAATPSGLERAEEELKRERISYLRARRLAYFGSELEAEVDSRLDKLRYSIDDLFRSSK